MTTWEALVLGFVQGATEFLPVSSSGHLVIGQALLGLQVPGIVFEVTVHLATLVSVVWVYRSFLADLGRGLLRGETEARRYLGLLLAGSVPAGVIGITLSDQLERIFDLPWITGAALLTTGTFLVSARWAPGLGRPAAPEGLGRVEGLDLKRAFAIGCAQAFALVPGISRSGATVVAGLWLGVGAVDAAAFSFLLSIPAIGGAALLELGEVFGPEPGPGGGALVAGGLVAVLTGIVAIHSFVALLRRQTFHRFAYYVWFVGAAFLLYLWVG